MFLLRLTGEVACRRCRSVMHAGEPAVARIYRFLPEPAWSAYHPECLLDVEPSMLAVVLDPRADGANSGELPDELRWARGANERGRAVEFSDKAALRERASKREAALSRIRMDAHNRRVRKVVEGGAAVRRKDEIALDRKGRPRVEVLFSVLGVDRMHSDDRAGELMPDRTFASSLREYVLVESGKHAPLRLPWQPLIGALFIVYSDSKVTRRVLERFVQWNAFALPTPVLWILGPPGATRDSAEQQVRAFLDEAGFVGDTAPALVSDALTAESLSQLGALLDDSLSIDAPPARAVDARETLLATLETAVNEERTALYSTALAQVAKRLRGMTPAMKARAADCAAACLAEESARKSALTLLRSQPHRRAHEAIYRALRSILLASRTVTKDARAVWELLVEWEDEGRFAVLCELVCAEAVASKRSVEWLDWLTSARDPSVAAHLKTWAESLDDKDPRKATARDLARSIERAAKRAESEPRKRKAKGR